MPLFDTSRAVKTIAAIARDLGISERRVEQIQRDALTNFLAECEARAAALGLDGARDYLLDDTVPVAVPVPEFEADA